MKTHILKTHPDPFAAVLSGEKRHEIRVDDRGFAVGDVLELREWVPHERTVDRARLDTSGTAFTGPAKYENTGECRFYVVAPHYTGRSIRARVTYKTPGGTWGLPKEICVMSIERVDGAQP